MKKIFLINNTITDYHYGCYIVIKNIMENLKKRDAICVGEMYVGNYEITTEIDRALRDCDFVIVNGEGTLHDASIRAISLLLAGVKVKICYGKKVYLINASYINNNKYMNGLLKYYDKIYVRDGYSLFELRENGVYAKQMPDMTFYSQYKQISPKSALTEKCVQDSVLSDITKKLHDYCRGIYGKWIPLIDKQKELSERKFLSDIANAQSILTGRYHGVCLAIQNRVPFLAVESNISKIGTLLNELGMRNRLISINEIEKGLVVPIFSLKEDEQINKYVEYAVRRIGNVFDEIFNENGTLRGV